MKLLSVRPSRPTMSVSALLLIRSCVLIGRAVQQECRDRKSGSAGMPRSEERFSRNAETDLVCRLLLEKKKREKHGKRTLYRHMARIPQGRKQHSTPPLTATDNKCAAR